VRRAGFAVVVLVWSAAASAASVRFVPVIDGVDASMQDVTLVVRDLDDIPVKVVEDTVSKDKFKLDQGRYDAMLRFLALPTEPIRYVRFEVEGKGDMSVRVDLKTAPLTVAVEPALAEGCKVEVDVENSNSGHKAAMTLGQVLALSTGSPYKARVKATCGATHLEASASFYHDAPRTVTLSPRQTP